MNDRVFLLFDDGPGAKDPDTLQAQPGQSAITKPESYPGLRCVVCEHIIADPEDRSAAAGRFKHIFINPAGFTFEIGCFANAPGAETGREYTTEYTWFAGFAWAYTRCGSCGSHLGWHYAPENTTGTNSRFFGLILDKLVPRL